MRGDRQVAGTGRRVDVDRLAARRARERRKSYRPSRDLLVEPAALRPGLQAVEVEIGAKTQRINRAAEGAFEFAHTGKVDNVQALGRHRSRWHRRDRRARWHRPRAWRARAPRDLGP